MFIRKRRVSGKTVYCTQDLSEERLNFKVGIGSGRLLVRRGLILQGHLSTRNGT